MSSAESCQRTPATGSGPEVDFAVDPVDGTTLTAKSLPNALAIVAVSEGHTMFDPGPCVYTEKIACTADRYRLLETRALAGAAANVGSTAKILSGRPGSWEAARVREVLESTVGADDEHLLQHRTTPVTVDLWVDNILLDVEQIGDAVRHVTQPGKVGTVVVKP
jgi:hypothetical protein